MKSLVKILALNILISFTLSAQIKTVKGTVLDDATSLPVEGVNILFSEGQASFITNNYGNFEILFPSEGKYEIIFSRIGYKSYRLSSELIKRSPYLEIRLIPTEITLGEVTVTSTKYSKLEKEVALPLEVVSSEKLEKNLSLSVPDILNNEPGITVVRDGIWGTDINIRGLSRQNIVTLVDGNRVETATNHAAGLSLIDMFDIQRIEVIKGGVSSLYGTGATGGVVNVMTKSPSYTNDLYLSGTLSSGYNSVNEGGIGNLSLIASSDKAL